MRDLTTTAQQHATRARQQLLGHYRDLQAALHALSRDFDATGLNLTYDVTITKTFYSHAHNGTPLKATLSLTLVDMAGAGGGRREA